MNPSRGHVIGYELLRVEEPEPISEPQGWLERASDLLAEGDPGPTPWAIENLIVDNAIVALVGKWKTTKTYAELDMAISIVTGQPFLGRFEIPTPGPVVLILEESGRAALWRRLDSLCRGRAIERDALAELHFAANRRVKIDDASWQNDLVQAGLEIRPRMFFFDPLARLKAPGLDESAQKEYAHVVEFMRHLRDETGAGVGFVQHQGHQGDHMRGTSDLESVWESRLGFKRDGGTITIDSEHREAESGPRISYRIDWDELTRTIRLAPTEDDLETLVRTYLAEHPDASANEVHKQLGGRKTDVLAEVKRQREAGGSQAPEPPGTTPLRTPSAVVPPTPSLLEGSGTTSGSAGSHDREPPT